MIQKSFGDFVNRKRRESIKQLELVEKLLKKQGLKTENHIHDHDEDDPYIFCFNPQKNTSFDGIRIYKIGDSIAFRIQKESKTHPYGRAYPINIEDMFHDFLTEEDIEELQAGKMVIEAVAKEIRRFFDKSTDAEKENRRNDMETQKDPMGNVQVRSQANDYSNMVFAKN